MATATKNPISVFSDKIKPLLNGYEDFTINQNIPGIDGYVFNLRTNLVVHIKYTNKSKFIPYSVYSATSITALPNMAFMDKWLKNAREAATKLINKGEYTNEKLVAGEYQPWKRKFNQWFYYNRKLNILVGEVHNTLPVKTLSQVIGG